MPPPGSFLFERVVSRSIVILPGGVMTPPYKEFYCEIFFCSYFLL